MEKITSIVLLLYLKTIWNTVKPEVLLQWAIHHKENQKPALRTTAENFNLIHF